MPILVDYSGTVHAAVFVDINKNRETSEDYLRHLILNQLRSIRQKFKNTAGEPILCMDSKNGYWRRDVFPYYKASRKEKRLASGINWKSVFGTIDIITSEIIDNLPYKVLRVPKAEADDIIGTIVLSNNWDSSEKCVIVSNDHDFKQLHGVPGVKQYFPKTHKLERIGNPRLYLIEHILKGDTGDGIPNVRSASDIFVSGEKKRQLPVTTKFIKEILSTGIIPEENRERFKENETLIDLRKIPEALKESILSEYINTKRNGRSKLMPYLIQHDLNYLLDRMSDF